MVKVLYEFLLNIVHRVATIHSLCDNPRQEGSSCV